MSVYTIVVALRPGPPGAEVPGHEFLMVHNRKRGGWELPGGRAEPGESAFDCAAREFREETGRQWLGPSLVQRRSGPLGEGYVFVCRAGEPEGPLREAEITEARFFAALPPRGDLSFPDDPYAELFAGVRRSLASAAEARKRGH